MKRGGALYPISGLGASGRDEADQRGITISTTHVRAGGAQLEEVRRLLDDGTICVAIDSSFRLPTPARRMNALARATFKARLRSPSVNRPDDQRRPDSPLPGEQAPGATRLRDERRDRWYGSSFSNGMLKLDHVR